jgi:hypothetical protein
MPGKEFYKDMEKSEIVVAGYLNDMGFDWYYEHPLFVYDEKDRPRVWTPDFYIPSLQLHLEVCGAKDFDYEYRKQIYEKNDVPVVFLHLYKDREEWLNWLRKSILEIEEDRHSKVMKLVKKLLVK